MMQMALLLLTAQIFALLFDMGILSFEFFKTRMTGEKESVGQFVSAYRNVKARSQKSLIWQRQEKSDLVHYYDSILTLDQSSAQIVLKESTKLSLAENTLVVIEPPKQEGTDRLRLIFKSGHLRSSVGQSRLESHSWVVDAESGSDVNLTSIGERVEVEVTSGRVSLMSESGGSHEIESGQVLELSETKIIERRLIDPELRILGTNNSKIYSHQWPLKFNFEWNGPAEKLRVIEVGGSETEYELRHLRDLTLELKPGSYAFTLVSGEKVSRTFIQHFFASPVIHLISPLPRERVLANQPVGFVWQGENQAKSYRMEILNLTDGGSAKSELLVSEHPDARAKIQLPEGAYAWRVIGIDASGAEIPNLYQYKIFSLPNPLQAPETADPFIKGGGRRPPAIRQPANSNEGAFLQEKEKVWLKYYQKILQLFLPSAHANSGEKEKIASLGTYEALFSWESVPGAVTYTIEISTDPLFRNPIVLQEISDHFYRWSGFPEGLYYWRVAAGGEMGPMGYYSPVATVRLAHTDSKENKSNLNKVQVRRMELAVKGKPIEKVAVPEKTEADLPTANYEPQNDRDESNESLQKPKVARFQSRSHIAFGTGFSYWNYNLPDDLKVSGEGATPFFVDLDWRFSISNSGSLGIKADLASYNISPKDRSDLPFQNDLEFYQADFALSWFFHESPWSVSFDYRILPLFERVEPEKVGVQAIGVYGMGLGFRSETKNQWNWNAKVSLMGASEIYDFHFQGNLLYTLSSTSSLDWALGGMFSADLLNVSSKSGWKFELGPQVFLLW